MQRFSSNEGTWTVGVQHELGHKYVLAAMVSSKVKGQKHTHYKCTITTATTVAADATAATIDQSGIKANATLGPAHEAKVI